MRPALLLVVFVAACPAKTTSSGGGYSTPQAAPTGSQPAPALPGTYTPGLGNPVIYVENHMPGEITIYVTDAGGSSQQLVVEPEQVSQMTVAPGSFSYSAYHGSDSLTGAYTLESDHEYNWVFAPQDQIDSTSGAGAGAGAGAGDTTVDTSGYESSNNGCPAGAADCSTYCCVDDTFCCDQGCCRMGCGDEAPVNCGSYCCYSGTTCAGDGQCQTYN